MAKKNIEERKMDYVVLKDINKFYDNGMHAVVDFNLSIAQNEFIVFVGPSGCGKSTTLRMIAGLEDITSGEFYIDDKLANDLEPIDRDVAMVFQSYALYPNMTIYDNIAFPLEMRKDYLPVVNSSLEKAIKAEEGYVKGGELDKYLSVEGLTEFLEGENFEEELEKLNKRFTLSLKREDFLKLRKYSKKEIDKRVKEAAQILEIADQLQKKPKALSGGQRQRVALGRAIVRHSKILLMDEPLSNLDAKLRVYMRSEIVRLHERTKSTTIYVTHDQTEAMTMADRIVVMSKGYVQQIGTPEEIYKHPANKFVAGFIGAPAMNFVDCHMRKNVLEFVDGHKVKLDESIIKWVKGYYEKQLAEWKETLPQVIEERKAQTLREWKARKHRLGRKYSFSEETDPVVSRYLNGIKTMEELVKGDEYPLTFGIRPEAMKEDAKGDEYEVILSELLGDEYYVHLMFGGKECLAKISADKSILKGSKIKLGFSLDKVHLFDPISEKAIF